MEQYKKTFYIYLIIICIEILVVLGFGLWQVLFEGETVGYILSEFNMGVVIASVLYFIFSFAPVFISGKNLPWRHLLVWIIPVLLLIPALYLFYHTYTCTGKFCNILDSVMLYGILLLEITYVLCYVLANYLRKWDVSISVLVLKVFLALFTVTSLFIAYNYITVIRPYQKLVERVEESDTLSVEEAVTLCDQVNSDRDLAHDCWRKAIKHRPSIDICSLAKDKTNCLHFMLQIYHESTDDCHHVTEEYLKDTDGKYKTDTNGNWLVDQPKMTELHKKCWTDMSKKYPGTDICLDSYGRNDEECRLFLGSKK